MAIEQKIYKTTFKLRRGQSADWTSVNPLLADGEPGFELDTGKLKIGNGSTNWNDLAYIAGPDYADTDLTNYYTKDEINNLISELNSAIDNEISKTYATKQELEEAINSIDVDLTGYATEEWVNSQGFLKEIPSNYITESILEETLATYVTEEVLANKEYISVTEAENLIKSEVETQIKELINPELDYGEV